MGVIISDFEVVMEPPPAGEAEAAAGETPAAGTGSEAPASGVTPDDVRRVVRHRERRRARLWAH